jgi:phage-related protein
MMHFLDMAVAFLNSAMSPVAMGTIALVVEFVLRAIPSEKPRSLLLAVSAGVSLVAAVVSKIAQVIQMVADFLAKVLQNVKPSEPQA